MRARLPPGGRGSRREGEAPPREGEAPPREGEAPAREGEAPAEPFGDSVSELLRAHLLRDDGIPGRRQPAEQRLEDLPIVLSFIG